MLVPLFGKNIRLNEKSLPIKMSVYVECPTLSELCSLARLAILVSRLTLADRLYGFEMKREPSWLAS